MEDPTYDADTMTVRADDGEPMSVFDQDVCPRCGGDGLTHVPAGEWYDAEHDHVFCFARDCDFHAMREAVTP